MYGSHFGGLSGLSSPYRPPSLPPSGSNGDIVSAFLICTAVQESGYCLLPPALILVENRHERRQLKSLLCLPTSSADRPYLLLHSRVYTHLHSTLFGSGDAGLIGSPLASPLARSGKPLSKCTHFAPLLLRLAPHPSPAPLPPVPPPPTFCTNLWNRPGLS